MRDQLATDTGECSRTIEVIEPYLPTAEEIKAGCAKIQAEWTITERLSRGKVTLTPRTQSEYLHQPRRRRNKHRNVAMQN